ncbi:VOC family protein [Nitratireductor mangrovi]|uniref:VOC family protein n=1 Tax=Nitratireductor mangrovi TaxID=2599600 RepID=A0A5B8KTV4_9HYPH|nr:VOC family protein [Nitratireductor mangrovi]QDY98998.1 VOC family protein [Nitratireductor mangrovi]
MQNKISTWLWFETEAEEAARFYASVFRRTELGEVARASGGGEPYMQEGQVITAEVTIEGQQFVCLNGGKHPEGIPNDSVSFQILCADQAEVDEYWNKLAADGGREVQCGWVKDKYGFAWQIVPEVLYRYMNGPDREAATRVTAAMMKMVKLDVAELEAAARG